MKQEHCPTCDSLFFGDWCPYCVLRDYITAAKDDDAKLRNAEAEIDALRAQVEELEAQLCGKLMDGPELQAMLLVLAELRRAKHKHPAFAATLAQGLDVLDGEYNELFRAIVARDIHGEHGVIREAAQCAAVTLRIIVMALGMGEVANA